MNDAVALDVTVSTNGVDAAPRETRRYLEKQQCILDAASALINTKGTAGMTLAAVADAVGLNTASVTYYYKRRDDLALACYHRALEQIEAMVSEAARESNPRARVRRYIALNVERLRAVREGSARPITVLSELRTMDDPLRIELADRYRVIMRQVRAFFGPDRDERHKALLVARVHMLLENCYWLPAWIGRYASDDFPRLIDRMVEVLEGGLRHSAATGVWIASPPPRADAPPPSPMNARDGFLLAATRLINDRGYRGASVQRIASELNVTKGSFYHHLEAKDDLVMACFDRNFDTIAAIQLSSDAVGATHWDHLATSVSGLIDFQFSDRGPLLQSSALQSLPIEFREHVIDSSNRVARRFAGTMIDGVSEGSIRAIDPLIASQMLMATINAAYELRRWASDMSPDEAMLLYGSTIMDGLFHDFE